MRTVSCPKQISLPAMQQSQQPGNANLPMPPNPMETGGPATRIVQLTEAVTMEELANDEEYQDIVDDMRDECGKVSDQYCHPFKLAFLHVCVGGVRSCQLQCEAHEECLWSAMQLS